MNRAARFANGPLYTVRGTNRNSPPAVPLPGTPDLIVSICVLPDVVADSLIAIPGYEEIVLARAQMRMFAGMCLPVCSPEDLVI